MVQDEEKIVIDKDLIVVDLDVESSLDVISELGRMLVDKKFVKQEYVEEVLKREQEFPTGLPTIIPVSLPHADARSCLWTAVAIGVLKKPVMFYEMGNREKELAVEVTFLLAISEPKEQVIWLKNMMKILRNKDLLSKIKNSKDRSTIAAIMKSELLVKEGDTVCY